MDFVIKARHAEVGDSFRSVVHEKLGRLTRLESSLDRVDVEVCGERNPRQAEHRIRVELTCLARGHVVRAEAAASDPFAALDLATAKLEMRLRRAADRRRVHHGSRTPVSLAAATSEIPVEPPATGTDADTDGEADPDRAPFVVREKEHVAVPMTLDQALFEMELVGHDFFLFVESTDGTPSVVYRRRGYDYGVLRLKGDERQPS